RGGRLSVVLFQQFVPMVLGSHRLCPAILFLPAGTTATKSDQHNRTCQFKTGDNHATSPNPIFINILLNMQQFHADMIYTFNQASTVQAYGPGF
ncbi:MAG: hypothetical protein RLN85_17815, partial [Pseudomonadales bacterium]